MDSTALSVRGAGWQLTLLLVGAIVMQTVVSLQGRHDQRYLERLSAQQLLSEQLARHVGETLNGSDKAFHTLRTLRTRLADNMEQMRSDEALPMTGLESAWKRLDGQLATVVAARDRLLGSYESVGLIRNYATALQVLFDEVAQLMAKKGASPEQLSMATRQGMLAMRILGNIDQVMLGGEAAVSAADYAGRDATHFARVVRVLLEGDEGRGVSDLEVLSMVEELSVLFDMLSRQLSAILEQLPELLSAIDAVNSAALEAGRMSNAISAQRQAYHQAMENRLLSPNRVIAITLALLLVMTALHLRRLRQERKEAIEAAVPLSSQQLAKRLSPYLMAALSRLLKGEEAEPQLTAMTTVLQRLLLVAESAHCRRFIGVAVAFIDGLGGGAEPLPEQSKMLLGKIEQQVRRLALQGEEGLTEEGLEEQVAAMLATLAGEAGELTQVAPA